MSKDDRQLRDEERKPEAAAVTDDPEFLEVWRAVSARKLEGDDVDAHTTAEHLRIGEDGVAATSHHAAATARHAGPIPQKKAGTVDRDLAKVVPPPGEPSHEIEETGEAFIQLPQGDRRAPTRELRREDLGVSTEAPPLVPWWRTPWLAVAIVALLMGYSAFRLVPRWAGTIADEETSATRSGATSASASDPTSGSPSPSGSASTSGPALSASAKPTPSAPSASAFSSLRR